MNQSLANLIQKIRKNHFYYFTALFAFFLPYRKFIVPILVFTIISWLLSNSFREKRENLKQNKTFLIFILPFVFYLIGMIYSDNQLFGWRDVETKFSLLLLPILYASAGSLDKDIRQLAYVYIFSMSTCAFLSILVGAIKYGQLPTYNMMDLFLHPSYLSMYLNLAMAFILLLFLNKNSKLTNKLLSLAFAIISSAIWLSLSKSGIILWVLIMLGVTVYNVVWRRKFVSLSLALITIGIGLSVFSYHKLPGFKERFSFVFSSISAKDTTVDVTTTESSQVRRLIWQQAIEIIKESPLLGTGTGDIKDELYVKYEEAGMSGALESKLNVHNQFLQLWATLGIVGFLAFILSFILPFYLAIKSRNYFYLAVLVVFGFNILFESMLERQDGVVFFAFFNSLLFFHANSKSYQSS